MMMIIYKTKPVDAHSNLDCSKKNSHIHCSMMKRVRLSICFQMFKLFWPQASKCLSLGFSHQLEKYTYKLLQSLLNSLIMCIVMLSSVQTVLDACMSGKCLQDLYFYSVLIWYELDEVKNQCNDFKFMSNETLIGWVDGWRRWIVLFFQIANVVVDCMVQKQSPTHKIIINNDSGTNKSIWCYWDRTTAKNVCYWNPFERKSLCHILRSSWCKCKNEQILFCFIFLFRLELYGLLTALTLPFACSIVCQHVHGWIVNIFSDHIRNRYQLVISYDTATYSIRSTISPITPHYYSHFCRLFIFLLLQCSNAHYYIVVYCYSASIWCTAITINIIQTNITFNGSTIKMILFFFVLSLFQTILIPSSVYNVYYANYRLQGNVALNTI